MSSSYNFKAVAIFALISALAALSLACSERPVNRGNTIAANALSPKCKVIGVEPKNADDATRSFHTRTLQTVHNPDTIADGARTPSLGEVTFPLVLRYVSDMITVSEEAILATMFFLWERMKLVVEPTGVLAAAALISEVFTAPKARVGVLISGGNVDLRTVGELLQKAPVVHVE